MPWTKVHRLDNDGNTIITHEKSQVHAEDVLKEFRKRNKAIRSIPYVREIHAQLRGLGPLRKQRKGDRLPDREVAESNIDDKIRKDRGVWSDLMKPYKPVGNMSKLEETKRTFNLRIQRMKSIYKKKRYDNLRAKQGAAKRKKRMKALEQPVSVSIHTNIIPSLPIDEFKSRSVRIQPSIFPTEAVKTSTRTKKRISAGIAYNKGMDTIEAKHKLIYDLLNLKYRSNQPSTAEDTGREAKHVHAFNTDMNEIALDMKNFTNGQIVLKADAKANDDMVHLLTADVGENARKAALYTERCRLENLRKLRNNTFVLKSIKAKRDRINRKSSGYVQNVRRKCQGKVESWMDGFKTSSNSMDRKLEEKLVMRALNHLEVANRPVDDFNDWGFDSGPLSLSPSKKCKKVVGNNSSTIGGEDSFWDRRKHEIFGISDDGAISETTTQLYRSILIFLCLLEGDIGSDELELAGYLKHKFESGHRYDKLMFCESWHLFSSKVSKNLRLGFMFEYLYTLLEQKI
eukprot:g2772.t1